MDGLGRQTDMPHDRDVHRCNGGNGFGHVAPALDLDRLGAAFLDQAPRIVARVTHIGLIGHERHIDHNKSRFNGTHNGFCMIDHLVHGDGQSRIVPRHCGSE